MADKKTSLSPAKNIFKDQRVLLAIVIALIVVIISCINPNFIGINNIVAIFQQICGGGKTVCQYLSGAPGQFF